ncbi:MAG: hypothetical protein QMD22_11410, partial [archaeon]|nr:hypothetical protein [archaeon]
MERKTIAGLIAIVAIVAIPMFAGCIDEEEVTPPPSPIPTSTPTSLVTPAPTHSPVPYTGPEVEYPGSPTNVTLPTIPSNQSLIPPSMYYPYNLFPESGASDVSLDTYISVSFTRPPGILKLEIEPEAKIRD